MDQQRNHHDLQNRIHFSCEMLSEAIKREACDQHGLPKHNHIIVNAGEEEKEVVLLLQ